MPKENNELTWCVAPNRVVSVYAHRSRAHTQKPVIALINYLTFHLGGDGLQSPHNKHREYIITCVLANM